MTITEQCPACASRHIRASYQVPDHEYRLAYVAEYSHCADCGTLYQHLMPDTGELSRFYPAHYHSFSRTDLLLTIRHRLRLKRLMSYLETDSGVVLDFGCGDGSFIKAAAQLTSRIAFWGYEIADRAGTRVSHGGRVTIVTGGLDDLFRCLPQCDMITMNHVIEHLPDPLLVLTSLRHRLNSGGTIEGQTPAADSFERLLFGRSWSGFHAPRHTVIFSRGGLKRILRAAHFGDAEVDGACNPAGIAVSLASLSQRNHSGDVKRKGLPWLIYLSMATALYPIDRFSGAPGIVNFAASNPSDHS